MDVSKIKALFISGLCDEIPEDVVDKKDCEELYSGFQKDMKAARCRCKHARIRQSWINKFLKKFKNN